MPGHRSCSVALAPPWRGPPPPAPDAGELAFSRSFLVRRAGHRWQVTCAISGPAGGLRATVAWNEAMSLQEGRSGLRAIAPEVLCFIDSVAERLEGLGFEGGFYPAHRRELHARFHKALPCPNAVRRARDTLRRLHF